MIISKFQNPDGTHLFLSNFFPSPLVYEGLSYLTVEHAYQAAKSLDTAERVKIADTFSPGQAKRMGRRLTLRPDWEAVKLSVMRDLLRLKFSLPHLRDYLLNTGDAFLIEGNTWGDRIWGQDPVGVGENWLGFLLMGVRAELRGRD